MSAARPEFRSKLGPALGARAEACLARHARHTAQADLRALRSLDGFLCDAGYDGGEVTEGLIDDWAAQLSSRLAPATVEDWLGKARQALRTAHAVLGTRSFVVGDGAARGPRRPAFRSALGRVLDAYADRCEAEHAVRTLESDYRTLGSLDAYLAESGYDGGAIGLGLLEGWASQLLEGASPATVAQYERRANVILRFAGAFGVESTPIEPIGAPDAYQPYIFSPDQLRGLCAAADDISFKPLSSYPWIRAEVPVLTRVYMGCGTRTSETLALRMRDVDLERGVLTMRATKNRVERYVPLADGLRDTLEAYCRAMGVVGSPDAYLFPGLDRESCLPRNMYYNSFRKMVAGIGIDARAEHGRQRGVCPYCMRHTFACMALLHLQERGVVVDNLHPYLSAYMGHRGLYSTERYLKLVEPLASMSLEGYREAIGPVFSGRAFDRDEVWD